jgi:hypothetical protein
MANDYRVAYGEHERHEARFDTFASALKLGRELQRLYLAQGGDPYCTVGIYRTDGGQLTSDQLEQWLYGDEDGDASVEPAAVPCDHCGSVTGNRFPVDGDEERCSECVNGGGRGQRSPSTRSTFTAGTTGDHRP